VHDVLVDRIARRAKAGEFAVVPLALQDIALRRRLAGDLIGDRALDDRPRHPTRAGLVLDILETAIDNRVDRVELALDPFRSLATTASFSAVAPVPAAARTIPTPIAITGTTPRTSTAIAIGTRFLRRRSASGGRRPITTRPIATRPVATRPVAPGPVTLWSTITPSRRATGWVRVGIGDCRNPSAGACFRADDIIAGTAELRWPAPSSAPPQRLAVGA